MVSQLNCETGADGIRLMQIVSNIALITINETLIVQLISFLLFLYLINRVMFRPLREAMSERDSYIENLRREISDQQKELQKLSARMKESEQAVVREAHHLSNVHEETGSREAAQLIATTRTELHALKVKTGQEVENRIVEAREQLRTETHVLAMNIMEKILERRLAS
jgi:F-type H+-transporting ATPase subunit b